jgi:hypothetical protein
MLVLAGALAVGISGIAGAQRKVAREPAMGEMRPGERLLVDDGSCPTGQIKLVTGGNHVKVGGNAHVERSRRCVSRRR